MKFSCRLAVFAGYTIFVAVFLALLQPVAWYGGPDSFIREGIVEAFQVLLLVLVLVMPLARLLYRTRYRTMLPTVAGCALLGLIREFDFLLDRYIPVMGWKLPAAAVLLAGGFLLYRYRGSFYEELRTFTRTPAFAIMWCGVLCLAAAQSIGHGAFLEEALETYHRGIKRVVEEGFETFSYSIIFIGTVEMLLSAHPDEDEDGHPASD